MESIKDFKELKYVRPDFDKVEQEVFLLALRVENACTFEEIKIIIKEFEEISSKVETSFALAFIRTYLDCTDKYYAEEMQASMARKAAINYNDFFNNLLNSKFKNEINDEYGEQFLIKLKDSISLKKNGVELLAREQELICQYQQLKATLKVEFKGETLSEGAMDKYINDTDREIRKEACYALNKAFYNEKKQFDDILDELVKVRNEIARVNGFSSYADYMNIEKGRCEYGQKELLEFCKNIDRELIDFNVILNNDQAKRLGLEDLTVYDGSFNFVDGNAKPIGNGLKLREEARKMYDSLGDDISELYNAMVNGNYIDVSESENKISGMGFCTELFDLKFPYVFGNCNGSFHDVTVLTHEIGHAYQMYLSLKNQKLDFYSAMPNDVAEIPSKCMEHFALDFAELFFGEDKEKFCFQQLSQAITETLAFSAIHQYESWLYEHSEATADERAIMYFEGIKKMNPNVDYTEITELAEAGSLLYRSMGVYMFPFYLISYAISNVSAMEMSMKMNKDKKATWEDYKKLCAAGGSLSYSQLLKMGNLNSPFEKETITNSLNYVKSKVIKEIKSLV